MIKISKAEEKDTEVLALLGAITYTESHGHFIDNKKDLQQYNEDAFSVSKIRVALKNPNTMFYLIYKNDLPIGYAKITLHSAHEKVASQNSCQLERIYILNDYIPLKIGQQFLTFIEDSVKALQCNTIWLSVYTGNTRAIRFYKRNLFKEVGKSIFLVNGKAYKNKIFSKTL